MALARRLAAGRRSAPLLLRWLALSLILAVAVAVEAVAAAALASSS